MRAWLRQPRVMSSLLVGMALIIDRCLTPSTQRDDWECPPV
jgi:hypothetical protein